MIIILASHPAYDLKELSKSLAMRFGINFVELDEKSLHKNTGIFNNPPSENAIYAGTVLAHRFAEDSIKIYIKFSTDALTKKLMSSSGKNYEETLKQVNSEELQKADYLQKFFGIVLNDLNCYDLVINSDKLDNEGIMSVAEKYINKIKK